MVMRSGSRLAAMALFLGGCGVSAGAAARPAPQERAGVLQAVFDCKRLTDPQLRLACYDRATGALDAAETQGEVVVIDRAQARTVRRQAFGLNMPSINLFSRGEKEEAVNRIEAALTSARQAGDGRWLMTTADNQVWRQTDNQGIFRPPHAGSTLAVRRGALGSFFCNVDGQLAVRCERGR